MNPSGPLRAGLSRYRRHKLSLDGGTPGIEYSRFQGGIDRPTRSSEVGQRPAGTTYNNDPLPVVYDPGIGPYQVDTPAYDQPEPRHDAAGFWAPSPPPGPVPSVHQQHMGPPISGELAAWLLQRFVNALPSQAAPDAIPLDNDLRFEGLVGSTLDEQLEEGSQTRKAWGRERQQAMYEASLMSAELFAQQMAGPAQNPSHADASALPEDADYATGEALDYIVPEQAEGGYDPGPVADMAAADYSAAPDCFPDSGMGPMSPTPDPTEPAPDQLQYDMPLEDIIEHEMRDMDPYEMMDPYHALGPYGPMPDPRMMGMPMDPFGPMGPMM